MDAICAAAFASFVVEPPLTSPGGGGALLLGDPTTGWEVIDCMSTTPGMGLSQRPILDFHGVEVCFGPTNQTFHVGRGAVAVPGLMRGLYWAHQKRGRLPWSEIIQPAIRYGQEGFVLGKAIHWVHHLLAPIVTLTPGIRALSCLGDPLTSRTLAPAGSALRNRPLGDFFEHLARDPEDAMAVFNHALLHEFGPETGGLLTRADLEHWKPGFRKPLSIPWNGYQVYTNGAPSSGGGLVAFALRLFERLKLPKDAYDSPAHVNAIADVLGLVSEARVSGYDASVHKPGGIDAFLADRTVDHWAMRLAALQEERQQGNTTHISVMDHSGGAASMTTSNGEGCGHVIESLGIHMNNFLGEEDINPDGFHNFQPGQRMSTMMAPTLVLSNGRPVLALGSGGSNRIRSAVFQGLVNHLWFDRPLEEAVNAPRIHVEGNKIWHEHGLNPAGIRQLNERWPEVTRFDEPNMFFGGVHAVAYEGDHAEGAGDRRRGGVAR